MQGFVSLTDLELLLEGLFNRVLEPIVRMEKLIMTTIAEEAAAIDTLATNYTALRQIVAEIEANYNALKSNPATVISPADQVLLDASFAKAQALNTQVVADTATATAEVAPPAPAASAAPVATPAPVAATAPATAETTPTVAPVTM